MHGGAKEYAGHKVMQMDKAHFRTAAPYGSCRVVQRGPLASCQRRIQTTPTFPPSQHVGGEPYLGDGYAALTNFLRLCPSALLCGCCNAEIGAFFNSFSGLERPHALSSPWCCRSTSYPPPVCLGARPCIRRR